MISCRAGLFAAAFAAAALVLPAVSRNAESPRERLSRLYEEGRYFDLRDGVAALKGDPSPEAEFLRGAVDQIFNRLDSAVLRLEKYLRDIAYHPVQRWSMDAQFLLADAFYRRGNYGEAARMGRRTLERYGPLLNSEEKENCLNQANLWAALSDVPRQTVEVNGETTIGMDGRLFPVRVGGQTGFFEYDTGSTISVLSASAAVALGVVARGRPVRVQTGTGERIDGRVGIIREMSLGAVVIRNAVFLILPDDVFPAAKRHPGKIRSGILGMPVLAAFREFSETRDGDLIIPARPRMRAIQNMGFSGFRPFIEVDYREERLSLCLDTGANATVLYPPFYRIYRGWIKNRTTLRKTKVEAVGGSRTLPIYVLDEFAFKAGGKDLAMRRVAVQTKVTHVGSRFYHGNLGLDILPQFTRMTFNFESMSFILE